MGKVVVLGGNARSGKSTLSNMLTKVGFSKISFDNLYEILKESLNINIDDMGNDDKFKLFENIINKSIEDSINNDINIIIDMYDFLPSDVNNLKQLDKLEVYFLAYPNQSIELIKDNILKYSKSTDWIAQVNDKYLDECVKRFYDRNELLVNECKKYNMFLIDTKYGKDRIEVLNSLKNKIINNK